MAILNTEKMAREIAEEALDKYKYEGRTIREWIEVFRGFSMLPPPQRREIIAESMIELDREETRLNADHCTKLERIQRRRDMLEEMWRRTYETD